MTETDAQVVLQEIVRDLEANVETLRGIAESLPLSPQERPDLLEVDLAGDLDRTSEVRRVIQCVLTDNLEPAVRDLRRLAEGQLDEPAMEQERG
jgi:hypothetical protein